MALLKTNVIANFSGQVWSALIGLAVVPVYQYYLGMESYGLIGFFVSLQALVAIMDMGLGTTTTREIARRQSESLLVQEIRNVVRTLEYIYFSFSISMAIIFFWGSDWIAVQWLHAETLSPDTLRIAVIIFGLTIALRWPVSLYNGVMRGLEKQVLLNKIAISITTLKNVGAVLVLIFVKPTTIIYFLIWQMVATLIEILLTAWVTWKVIPKGGNRHDRFDFSLLRVIWRFSAAVSFVAVFAVILKQVDKILISRLLTLEQLGYYSTAYMACMGLNLFTTSVFNAIFPRFSSLVYEQKNEEISYIYHKVAKLTSFAVCFVAGILIFFSYDILLLWTQSPVVASKSYQSLSILAFATMINSMMNVPYAMQLASGLTWIPLINNGVSVLLFTPVTYYLITKFGIIGGALAWATFNTAYYIVIPCIMHYYVLQNQQMRWIFKDTLPFIVMSFATFGGAYLIGYYAHSKLINYCVAAIGCIFYICWGFYVCTEKKPSIRNLSRFLADYNF